MVCAKKIANVALKGVSGFCTPIDTVLIVHPLLIVTFIIPIFSFLSNSRSRAPAVLSGQFALVLRVYCRHWSHVPTGMHIRACWIVYVL